MSLSNDQENYLQDIHADFVSAVRGGNYENAMEVIEHLRDLGYDFIADSMLKELQATPVTQFIKIVSPYQNEI